MISKKSIKKLILFSLTVSWGICFQLPVTWSSELALIVNPANSNTEITKTELVAIYMGKMTNFANSGAIKPVDYTDADDIKKNFYIKILEKDIEKMKRYWVKRIFSGQGSPPKALEKPSEVLDFVAKNEGGIGYIPKEMMDDRVKELILK